jgi:hypothetical protein
VLGNLLHRVLSAGLVLLLRLGLGQLLGLELSGSPVALLSRCRLGGSSRGIVRLDLGLLRARAGGRGAALSGP